MEGEIGSTKTEFREDERGKLSPACGRGKTKRGYGRPSRWGRKKKEMIQTNQNQGPIEIFRGLASVTQSQHGRLASRTDESVASRLAVESLRVNGRSPLLYMVPNLDTVWIHSQSDWYAGHDKQEGRNAQRRLKFKISVPKYHETKPREHRESLI